MTKASIFQRALILPVALDLSIVVVTWQALHHGDLALTCSVLALGYTVAMFLAILLRRRHLDDQLVPGSRTTMRRFDTTTSPGMYAFGSTKRTKARVSEDRVSDELAELLDSRRLVLLRGDHFVGRSTVACQTLLARYPGHTVLRPRRYPDDGKPPLTELLAGNVLSLSGRYILWLDDVGELMARGLDPRIIERWLAFGSHVAIGAITDAELQRIHDSRSQASYALERAAFYARAFEATAKPSRTSRAVRRFEGAKAEDATLIKVVAMAELLGSAGLEDDEVFAVVEQVTGRRPSLLRVGKLCQGDGRPLTRQTSTGTLAAHPEISWEVDRELSQHVDQDLFGAFLVTLEPERLLAMGQTLAVRGHAKHADVALNRAALDAGEALGPAITRARLGVYEYSEPSGATLSNVGGRDFIETMGPDQRDAAQRMLPKTADGPFDPKLPPERESRWRRAYRFYLYRAIARTGVLMLLDAVAIFVASIVALAVRATAQATPSPVWGESLLQLVLAAVPVTIVAAAWLGLYRPNAARARFGLILGVMTIVTFVVAAGMLITDADAGTFGALFMLFVVAIGADWTLRFTYDVTSRGWVRHNDLEPRVLFLGRSADVRRHATQLLGWSCRPIRPVAYLSEDEEPGGFCVGNYDDLEAVVHDLHIAEVVIVDRQRSTTEKARLIARAQRFGLDARFVANDAEVIVGAAGRLDSHGLVHVPGALISPEALALKRFIDYIIVSLLLPFCLGVLGIYMACWHARRRGQPALVSVGRVGLGQTGFTMLRLRTRRRHRDGSRGTEPWGRWEAFLEKTGMDELPQIVNVLKGDMSLVGPRPITAADADRLTRDQLRTLGARPGMTGRWQVLWTRRGTEVEPTEAAMRALDADYLRRWRLSDDIEILLRTPIAIALRGVFLGDTELSRRRGSPPPLVESMESVV